MIPQFDEHVLAAEVAHQPFEFATSRSRSFDSERSRHRAFATRSEYRPVITGAVAGEFDQSFVRDPGRAFLTGQLPLTDRSTETGVPLGPSGEDQDVLAFWIGRPRTTEVDRRLACRAGTVRLRRGRQREFGAENGRQPDCFGCLGEPDHTVEAVVVGERQRFESEPGCLLGQLLRMGGAIEERKVRVAMQLGVRDLTSTTFLRWRRVRHPLA